MSRHEERPPDDFEHLQSEGLRRRLRWALAFALALWGFAFIFADGYLYGSQTGKLGTRIFQFAWAGGALGWLRRPRSRGAMELVLLGGGGVMMVLSALSLANLGPDQLVFAVVSRLFGLFFIVHLIQLRWPAALIAYCIAVATLLVGYAENRIDGVHHIGLASMWVLAPIPLLTYGAYLRERRQREAFDLRAALVEANRRLASEVATRTRLFLGLSHDLRTPLSVIAAEAGRATALDDAALRAEGLRRIQANVWAAADLIDQLLELARLDEGKLTLVPTAFRLDLLLADLAAQLQPSRGVRIDVSGPEVTALAEPRHVRRIVMNLLGNALRHVDPEAGRVRVFLRQDRAAGRAEISVSDDGRGVPSELVPRLFERFATMSPAGDVVSGVGLPLARELAELNGGTLILASPKPATFVLTLPLSDADATELSRTTPASTPADGQPPRLMSSIRPYPDAPRVLVVEDHASLAGLLAEQLTPDLAVTLAGSLTEAREALAHHRFDVVVSDLGLPDGSGLELLTDLAALGASRPAFIVLSALGGPETRARTLSAGADDHLVKPYSVDELRARIERILRQARERELALERQREEVLGEVHDGVGGALARAVAMLRVQSDRGASGDRDGALAELEQAAGELRDGLRLLSQRDCAWGAVVADLRFSLATIAEAHGLEFSADCGRAEVSLRPAIIHALRRIATEALTNTVKHAEARSVRCAIRCEGAELRMVIADDGRGLPSPHAEGHGLGLMKARAARLGGRLEVGQATERGGVEVRLWLPLGSPAGSDPVGNEQAGLHRNVSSAGA